MTNMTATVGREEPAQVKPLESFSGQGLIFTTSVTQECVVDGRKTWVRFEPQWLWENLKPEEALSYTYSVVADWIQGKGGDTVQAREGIKIERAQPSVAGNRVTPKTEPMPPTEEGERITEWLPSKNPDIEYCFERDADPRDVDDAKNGRNGMWTLYNDRFESLTIFRRVKRQ